MKNSFHILEKEMYFSNERINYVYLKAEYQEKMALIRESFKEKLPERKNDGIMRFLGDKLVNEFTAKQETKKIKEAKAIFSEIFNMVCNYGPFQHFVDIRNKYISEYFACLSVLGTEIVESLNENGIEKANAADGNNMTIAVLLNSEISQGLNEAAEKISKSIGVSGRISNNFFSMVKEMEYYSRLEEENIIKNEADAMIHNNFIAPLNRCFFAYAYSNMLDTLIQLDEEGNLKNLQTVSNAIEKISNRVFSNGYVQDALLNSIGLDAFMFIQQKMKYFELTGLSSYEPITNDDIQRSNELYDKALDESCTDEGCRDMLAESLLLDPTQDNRYFTILDRFNDPEGELQELSEIIGINVKDYIEEKFDNIYKEGDMSTLEATLELKDKILKAEQSFNYQNSKAFKDVTLRQHFLELSRQAAEMPLEEVLEKWHSIQEGNNTFAVGERSDVSDEFCIIILKRRFLKIKAAEYHDTIRNLGLKDDTTEGEKNYAFYEEGEDYIDFEENCEKIIGMKLERDGDFSVQNYEKEKLASGEVILGYFHYTRAMDFVTDGKVLLITNKRIYTTKEKFTEFSCISECKPIKKLMLTYIIIDKDDGKKIQIPVSKELALPVADMMNRLITALKGTEYIAGSVVLSNSNNLETAKTAILDKTNSLKKGFGSLFGKKGAKTLENTNDVWQCNCGAESNAMFCSQCGAKRLS